MSISLALAISPDDSKQKLGGHTSRKLEVLLPEEQGDLRVEQPLLTALGSASRFRTKAVIPHALDHPEHLGDFGRLGIGAAIQPLQERRKFGDPGTFLFEALSALFRFPGESSSLQLQLALEFLTLLLLALATELLGGLTLELLSAQSLLFFSGLPLLLLLLPPLLLFLTSTQKKP